MNVVRDVFMIGSMVVVTAFTTAFVASRVCLRIVRGRSKKGTP